MARHLGGGNGHCSRKPLLRSGAAAARRAGAGALLLLAGALGVLGSAQGQTGTLVLNVGPIAGDDIVNIAEKATGFAISGDTGTEAGVSVTVTVGGTDLTTTSDANGAWVVSVPADADYITGPSVSVSVSVTKTGFTAAEPVTRALVVDLQAPMLPRYETAGFTLKVGQNAHLNPGTIDRGGAHTYERSLGYSYGYSATGLPSGLRVSFRGKILGVPDTADPSPATAMVTVTDEAGNAVEESIAFPVVAKG